MIRISLINDLSLLEKATITSSILSYLFCIIKMLLHENSSGRKMFGKVPGTFRLITGQGIELD